MRSGMEQLRYMHDAILQAFFHFLQSPTAQSVKFLYLDFCSLLLLYISVLLITANAFIEILPTIDDDNILDAVADGDGRIRMMIWWRDITFLLFFFFVIFLHYKLFDASIFFFVDAFKQLNCYQRYINQQSALIFFLS